LKFFYNFILQIEITMNCGSPKGLQTHSWCLDSSIFNHSRTTFPLTTSYFLAHYFGTCVLSFYMRKIYIILYWWWSISELLKWSAICGSTLAWNWIHISLTPKGPSYVFWQHRNFGHLIANGSFIFFLWNFHTIWRLGFSLRPNNFHNFWLHG